LLKHLPGQLVLLWDSGNQHKGPAVKQFLRQHPRLHTHRFPGYAPELNPDEFVWRHLKGAVANSNPLDLRQLKELLHPPLQRLRQSQRRLWSCIHASDLPWK
jgi:transposase